MIIKVTLLLMGLGGMWSVSANHHTLTLHMNDNMGSSGTLRCNSSRHCMELIKEFEYRRSPGDCNFVEIKAGSRIIYRKIYRD
ncbi:hypothetical protein [Candidatus Thioglobus sp.]|jgi:hypothetical protein|uniref:hypothetical protein n=1 Tax=Candidatus Thioglobus sp. TaxID=2026721 RepID=UPI001E17CBBF|nr:hypothetical protein [Candidatus Thioglobus sp.]MBT3276815.1 hypothetical protein [Candidatus Thioglobus sp.]MBT3745031.1 hypothetical protein [Candidatus Thioglobus sp.]MBT4000816.1 hypothetical protein [Candidatus Thioglobus sp.]MBT5164467.1 hypothetical protein [Candidatus Thioglobus sp.]MBT6022227.1 hypothetical protein [Candidatus Thioglobus sp.]